MRHRGRRCVEGERGLGRTPSRWPEMSYISRHTPHGRQRCQSSSTRFSGGAAWGPQPNASAYIYVSARVPQCRKLINRNVTMTSPALTRSARGQKSDICHGPACSRTWLTVTNGTAGRMEEPLPAVGPAYAQRMSFKKPNRQSGHEKCRRSRVGAVVRMGRGTPVKEEKHQFRRTDASQWWLRPASIR